MLLHHGERVIATDAVDTYIQGVLFHGVLHLTNRRLVLEARSYEPGAGWINRTFLDTPLVGVSNVTTADGTKGMHVLRVEFANGSGYNFATPIAQNWLQAIHQARMEAIPPPPPPGHQMPPPPSQVVVNVPQPQVYLHCRHCGTLNGSGKERCTACGATL